MASLDLAKTLLYVSEVIGMKIKKQEESELKFLWYCKYQQCVLGRDSGLLTLLVGCFNYYTTCKQLLKQMLNQKTDACTLSLWGSMGGVECECEISMTRESKYVLTFKYKYISLRDFLAFSLTYIFSSQQFPPKKGKRKSIKVRKLLNFYLH